MENLVVPPTPATSASPASSKKKYYLLGGGILVLLIGLGVYSFMSPANVYKGSFGAIPGDQPKMPDLPISREDIAKEISDINHPKPIVQADGGALPGLQLNQDALDKASDQILGNGDALNHQPVANSPAANSPAAPESPAAPAHPSVGILAGAGAGVSPLAGGAIQLNQDVLGVKPNDLAAAIQGGQAGPAGGAQAPVDDPAKPAGNVAFAPANDNEPVKPALTGAQIAERDCQNRNPLGSKDANPRYVWTEGACLDRNTIDPAKQPAAAPVLSAEEKACIARNAKGDLTPQFIWANGQCVDRNALVKPASCVGKLVCPDANADQNNPFSKTPVAVSDAQRNCEKIPTKMWQAGACIDKPVQDSDPAYECELDPTMQWLNGKCVLSQHSVDQIIGDKEKCEINPQNVWINNSCVGREALSQPAPVNGGGSVNNVYYYYSDNTSSPDYQTAVTRVRELERQLAELQRGSAGGPADGAASSSDVKSELAELKAKVAKMESNTKKNAAMKKSQAAAIRAAEAAGSSSNSNSAGSDSQAASGNFGATRVSGSVVHGAAIRGTTGPEMLLYPLLVAAANGMYYVVRRKK